MAENEIQILINAVDNATKTLDRIEGKMGAMQKEITKSTEKSTVSTDEQIGSFIRLGQAAQSVENMMSAYQNMQLRLENSAERLANATDRQSDAQTKLNRLRASGTATIEELTDAEKELERANRALTISQNNQARTQNMVLGTYISMGVQSLVLIKSMGELKKSVDMATAASMKFIATPWGLALTLLVTVIGSVIKYNNDLAVATENVRLAQIDYDEAVRASNDSLGMQLTAIKNVQNAMNGILEAQTPEEANIKRNISGYEAKLAVLDLIEAKGGQLTSAQQREYTSLKNLITEQQAEGNVIRANRQAYIDNTAAMAAGNEAAITGQSETSKILTMGYEEGQKTITEMYYAKLFAEEQRLQYEMRKRVELTSAGLSSAKTAKSNVGKYQITTPSIQDIVTGKVDLKGNKKTIATKPGVSRDFVMRPGQPAVNFSSDDTLIGTKSGVGGTTIVINGNNYGVDAKQIGNALMKQIKYKISA